MWLVRHQQQSHPPQRQHPLLPWDQPKLHSQIANIWAVTLTTQRHGSYWLVAEFRVVLQRWMSKAVSYLACNPGIVWLVLNSPLSATVIIPFTMEECYQLTVDVTTYVEETPTNSVVARIGLMSISARLLPLPQRPALHRQPRRLVLHQRPVLHRQPQRPVLHRQLQRLALRQQRLAIH